MLFYTRLPIATQASPGGGGGGGNCLDPTGVPRVARAQIPVSVDPLGLVLKPPTLLTVLQQFGKPFNNIDP